MQPIFLKIYRACKAGKRGLSITLPEAFCKINNIQPSDEVKVYMVKDENTLLLLQVKK
ncbi:MAG: hypothetical protein HY808_03080 [Nitrospirae bacterium]|nr:hypothetical protein [Nitrospirota bacterium]